MNASKEIIENLAANGDAKAVFDYLRKYNKLFEAPEVAKHLRSSGYTETANKLESMFYAWAKRFADDLYRLAVVIDSFSK